MEKSVKIFALVFMGLMIFCANGRADVITLRADEWCPYNCEPNSDEPGFMVDIARIVFKKAGHTVEYGVMPWARAIQDTRKGKYNGIIGAGKDDAPDFVFPENELAVMSGEFYVKKGADWEYKGLESLKDKVLGVIKDYTYSDVIDGYIEENGQNSKRVQVASGDNALDSNVKKLLAGRIDILIEDSNVMGLYIKENRKEKMLLTAGTLAPDELFIAFSPNNPKSTEYAKTLSDGIVDMRKSGELAIILEKYGLKDWK